MDRTAGHRRSVYGVPLPISELVLQPELHRTGSSRAGDRAPLRGSKATLYEGGTREPCVIVWPGVIKPDSRTDQILSSIDFYPTILDMAGVKPKDGVKFDGVSLAPALRGKTVDRGAVCWHFPIYGHYQDAPATSVRKGDWKLIRRWYDNDDRTHPPAEYLTE